MYVYVFFTAIIEQIQKDREAEEAKKNAGSSDQNEKKEEEPPTESGVNSTDANGSVSEGKGEADQTKHEARRARVLPHLGEPRLTTEEGRGGVGATHSRRSSPHI